MICSSPAAPPGSPGARSTQNGTLEILDRLFKALNASDISYCQWKSNFALERVLSGEKDDVDLLVDRRSLSQVITILLGLGYKPAIVKSEPQPPNVFHYYGFDQQIDHLVHLHLYGAVYTGESFINSHLLPFDVMLLASGRTIDGVKVPSKTAELVCFTLKVFVKYGSLLDLIYLLRETHEIEAEARWLLADNDLSEALRLVEKYCPVIEEQLFVKCVSTLSAPTSLVKRLRVAWQVRRRLKIYSRYSRLQRLSAYIRLFWGHGRRRLAGNKKSKLLHSGGAIVAFVGPEASGKSTLVSECSHWLGSVFTVKTVHAGKPPASWLTAPAKHLLPLLRHFLPHFRTTRLESRAFPANATKSRLPMEGPASLLYALRAVMVAWDRRQLLLRAGRSAANGEIAICDRYPSETIGAMDSPRLREHPGERGVIATLSNWLAQLECRLYAQIPPPDIVLRLNVSIDTAKIRNRERIKPDKESDAYLESRHRQMGKWHRSGTKYIYDIDTRHPLAETILNVKRAIWESL